MHLTKDELAVIIGSQAIAELYHQKQKVDDADPGKESSRCEIGGSGEEELLEEEYHALKAAIDWATVVAVGPGISVSSKAKTILKMILQKSNKPIVVDADALNILAQNESLLKSFEFGRRRNDDDGAGRRCGRHEGG